MVVRKSFSVLIKKCETKGSLGIYIYIYISLKYNKEEFIILRIYLNLNTTITTLKEGSFSVTLTFRLRRF